VKLLDAYVRMLNAVLVPDRPCPGRPIDWGDRLAAVLFSAVVAVVITGFALT